MLPLLLLLAQASATQPAAAPSEIVAAAQAEEWRAIAPEDLLVMELAPDASGPSTRSGPRRVVIQLVPPPFSQGWVGNIRLLARAHWWDGTSVNRVQDNYVVQWGDATEKKPLPTGLRTMAEADYVASLPPDWLAVYLESAADRLDAAADAAEHKARKPILQPFRLPTTRDSYADVAGLLDGFPVAGDLDHSWPVHCYGTIGVGRNLSPDTGSGAELYAVIGHAPRHLDRNIAVVGRVVEGIENLSSLPRGTEALGFYKTSAERVAIRSVRLASELPAAERPRFEYLSTESKSFVRYADARANRRDAFFIRPAGGADICNVPVPVRRVK